MKKKCMIVPKCPRCGSGFTGYYLYIMTVSEQEKLISKAMEHGELVRVVCGTKDLDAPNCFCDDCGLEWYAEIKTAHLSPEQIEQRQKDRDIDKQLIKDTFNLKQISKRNVKIQKKNIKREKRKTKIKKLFQT